MRHLVTNDNKSKFRLILENVKDFVAEDVKIQIEDFGCVVFGEHILQRHETLARSFETLVSLFFEVTQSRDSRDK